MTEEELFEKSKSGASNITPVEAGQIRKGGYMNFKSIPCKIVSISKSKSGKHGSSKVHFVGIGLFTGKKYEEIETSTHNVDVPVVFKTEYTLLDITDEGYVSMMDDSGETREDLKMPTYPEELGGKMREAFDAGDSLAVIVFKAMGEEHIMSFRKEA